MRQAVISYIKRMEAHEGKADDDSISKIIKASIKFPMDFQGFNGHFPGRPVLPAVVQLCSVRFLLELGYEQRLGIETIEHVKFRSVATPETVLDYEIQCREMEQYRYRVWFRIAEDGNEVSSGRIILVPRRDDDQISHEK